MSGTGSTSFPNALIVMYLSFFSNTINANLIWNFCVWIKRKKWTGYCGNNNGIIQEMGLKPLRNLYLNVMQAISYSGLSWLQYKPLQLWIICATYTLSEEFLSDLPLHTTTEHVHVRIPNKKLRMTETSLLTKPFVNSEFMRTWK